MPNTKEVQEAIKQYEVRQYDRAFSVFKKFAKEGDSTCLYYLGLMYYYGQECKQNYKEAFTLFDKARESRYIAAYHMLGEMFENGHYVDLDGAKAVEYYSAAFHEGYIESGIKIAELYEEGRFLELNKKKALETYVECAKKDHPYALYKIGMAYLQGDGLKKSIENAHLWLNKALLHGSIDAMNQFRYIGSKSSSDERSRETIFAIGKELFDKQRYNDALLYLEIAFKEGSIEALHLLVKIYEDGSNTEEAKEKAFAYLLEGSKKGDPYSLYRIGQKYELGIGCLSSYIKAEAYYKKAFDLGYLDAEKSLKELHGDIYER